MDEGAEPEASAPSLFIAGLTARRYSIWHFPQT
jgi:hypothetical protein